MQGVPQSERAWVWMETSGASELKLKQVPDYFTSHVQALWSSSNETIKQIDLDLARTFPEHEFIASPAGQLKLRQILVAFAGRHPTVGYCQGMNYVAAFLLEAVQHDVETAFWIFIALVEGVFPLSQPAVARAR